MRSFWLRLGIGIGGAAAIVASFFVPPAASVLAPLGAGAIGYALKAPGTLSTGELAQKGQAAAQAAAGAAADAVARNAGKSPATVAAAAGAAAAEAVGAEMARK